jgi:hypothetical protein
MNIEVLNEKIRTFLENQYANVDSALCGKVKENTYAYLDEIVKSGEICSYTIEEGWNGKCTITYSRAHEEGSRIVFYFFIY